MLLFFMSLCPNGLSKKRLKRRLMDYQTSLHHIFRIIPPNWEILICENTLSQDEIRISKLLRLEGKSVRFCLSETNTGEVNKGIGELDMMLTALDRFRLYLADAKAIAYFTGRRIMTNEFLFQKSQNIKKEAIISNPDFLYLDGEFLVTKKEGLYNDMFFTMKRDTFYRYAEYYRTKRDNFVDNGVGSEQILYHFVQDCDIDFEWLSNLGLIRRDEIRSSLFRTKQRIHVC